MNSLQKADQAVAAIATAPRVSLADIQAEIVTRYHFTAAEAVEAMGCENTPEPLKVLSLCILVLKNGWTVIGKSAPASPANFNAKLGVQFAEDDAIRQLWSPMGFALRDRLAGTK